MEFAARVVVQADMLVVFRKLLDRHMNRQRLKRFGSCAGIRDEFNLASFKLEIVGLL